MRSVAAALKEERTKGRILIIDDEKWICESLKLLLSRRGLDIETKLNGKDALHHLNENDADLIILDFNLPDLNGLDVLAEIRRGPASSTPVIFITGYGSETISIKAFKLGIADYFIKPFHPKTLEARVLEILGQNDQTQIPQIDSQLPLPDEESLIEDTSGIGRSIQYLKRNYKSRISLETISTIAGVSRFHFTRLFKEVMGISFSDYLNHLRVKKAEEMLPHNEMNISEVAYKSGFNSLRQFERTFKKITGKTPVEFRKKNGAING